MVCYQLHHADWSSVSSNYSEINQFSGLGHERNPIVQPETLGVKEREARLPLVAFSHSLTDPWVVSNPSPFPKSGLCPGPDNKQSISRTYGQIKDKKTAVQGKMKWNKEAWNEIRDQLPPIHPCPTSKAPGYNLLIL